MTGLCRAIGVDWGSTNRRAYLVCHDGGILERREDGAGVLSAPAEDYYTSLMRLVGDWWRDTGAAIWLSGMIGGRDGWREIPYLPVPLDLQELGRSGRSIAPAGTGTPTIRIIPGLSQRAPDGPADVMRGEETQLLGAWSLGGRDGWYVLPGTHSKWVRLERGRVVRFHTFMTGELFARLREKGALASITAAAPEDPAGFAAGVLDARQAALPLALFGIRAGVLLGEHPQAQASSRLSGMLIGAELDAAQRLGCLEQGSVFLIGAPAMLRWYELALHQHGMQAQLLDADACYLQALLRCLEYQL